MKPSKYTAEEKRKVLDLYFRGGRSGADVCRALGYPSQPTLSRWIREDPRSSQRRPGLPRLSHCGAKDGAKPRKRYPYEVKLEAVRLAEEERLTRREIAQRLGLCAPAMATKWVTIARKYGKDALMPKREGGLGSHPPRRGP